MNDCCVIIPTARRPHQLAAALDERSVEIALGVGVLVVQVGRHRSFRLRLPSRAGWSPLHRSASISSTRRSPLTASPAKKLWSTPARPAGGRTRPAPGRSARRSDPGTPLRPPRARTRPVSRRRGRLGVRACSWAIKAPISCSSRSSEPTWLTSCSRSHRPGSAARRPAAEARLAQERAQARAVERQHVGAGQVAG